MKSWLGWWIIAVVTVLPLWGFTESVHITITKSTIWPLVLIGVPVVWLVYGALYSVVKALMRR